MRTFRLGRPGPARILAAVFLLFGTASTHAGDSRVSAGPVLRQVGFAGQFKVGKWTPVEVEMTLAERATARLVVETFDPRGNVAEFPATEQTLDPGTHRLSGLFQSGRLDSPLRVSVVLRGGEGAGDGVVLPATSEDEQLGKPLTQSVRLVATLGHPAGFDPPRGQATAARGGAASRRVAHLDDAEQLPRDAAGYDGLDVLVISGPYALDAERDAALREWVRAGGHLVLAIGRHLEGFAAGGPDWLPVEIDERPLVLRDLGPVESFVEQSTRLPGREVRAARLGLPLGGEILIPSPQAPLLVRAAYGFGRVTAFALDLDGSPLAGWADLPAFVTRLISDRRDASAEATSRTGAALAGSGITDLATQLRVVHEEFPSVRRLPLWGVYLLILGYLVVIGPLDYLLVNKVLRKPRLTWITFPLMAAGAFALAAWGTRQAGGGELLLNQIDVVDIAAEPGQGEAAPRVRSWLALYSPEARRYEVTADLSLPGAASGSPPRLGWHAAPESTYGGLYRTGGFRVERPEYGFGPGAAGVDDFPIPLGGTGMLAADGSGAAARLVDNELEWTRSGRLRGRFTHHLPGPISDWMIAYNRRIFLPEAGDAVLEPGSPARVSEDLGRHPEIAFYLTKTVARRVQRYQGVGEEVVLEQGKYDPLGGDVSPEQRLAEIVRMMTFHEAAGGTPYTGLRHDALRDMDLSGHVLDLSRAVLFGRIDLNALDMRIDGVPVEPGRHFAFVRIVLPVEQVSLGE